MTYPHVDPVLVVGGSAVMAIWCLRYMMMRPPIDERETIASLLASQGWMLDDYRSTYDPWRNWMRGRLRTSNMARNLLAVASQADGKRAEIELIIDPWPDDAGPKIIEIRRLP